MGLAGSRILGGLLRVACPIGDHRLHTSGESAQTIVVNNFGIREGCACLFRGCHLISQIQASFGEHGAQLTSAQVQLGQFLGPLGAL